MPRLARHRSAKLSQEAKEFSLNPALPLRASPYIASLRYALDEKVILLNLA